MVNYARIAEHIDRGRGIAAKKLGPPFDAYRLDPTSNGDFPSGWLKVAARFPLYRRRLTAEAKIETGIRNTTLWYEIVANMDPFRLGDVFVQVDPPFVAGVSYGAGATSMPGTVELNAMALAWHPPVNKSVGARLDRLAAIYRPANQAAAMGDGSLYWKQTLDHDQPLVLGSGTFGLGTAGSGQGSLVPIGLSSAHRRGDAILGPGVPGMVKPSHWFVYLPPLPRYVPREGDAIVTLDDARYVVTSPFEQLAGVVGYQLLCDRKIAQAA